MGEQRILSCNRSNFGTVPCWDRSVSTRIECTALWFCYWTFTLSPIERNVWPQAGSLDSVLPCSGLLIRKSHGQGHSGHHHHSILCRPFRIGARNKHRWRARGHLGSNAAWNSYSRVCIRGGGRPNCRTYRWWRCFQSYLRWRWTESLTGIFMLAILTLDVLTLDESYPSRLLVYKARRLRIKIGNWALHAEFEEWCTYFRSPSLLFWFESWDMSWESVFSIHVPRLDIPAQKGNTDCEIGPVSP